MSDAATNIKEIKQLQPVRDAFVTSVDVSSWDEAKTKYPQHTTNVRLHHFIGQDMEVPSDDFVVWQCHS